MSIKEILMKMFFAAGVLALSGTSIAASAADIGLAGNFGGGVIKNDIKIWINDPEMKKIILTLCYAPPEMGGSGALLFLLKRKL